MPQPFEMEIQDVFRFSDERIVFVGPVRGDTPYIPPGPVEVWVDGERRGEIRIEGEMLSVGDRQAAQGGPRRAVSTLDTRCVDRQAIARGHWSLKSIDERAASERAEALRKGIPMHRHLLGLDSPPAEYVADPMTQGPVLPEGWDGDAWTNPRGGGYFLRAWHKETSRVAYGKGSTYEGARRALLTEIAQGARLASLPSTATST